MVIYLVRNTVNGKGYVGQTIRTVEERWTQHKTQAATGSKRDAVHHAIRKYGASAFEIAVIDSTAETLEQLNALEVHYIKFHNTLSPHGYNLTTGGFSYKRSAETIAKMSAATKGKKLSTETIEKMRAYHTGRKRSPEMRANMSAAMKGNHNGKGKKLPVHVREQMLARVRSPEFKSMMSERMRGNKNAKGYSPSAEARKLIGIAHKGNSYAKGHTPSNKGKKMPNEQRAKLRTAWVIRKARNLIHAVA